MAETKTGCEIEFLPVGNGKKNGDAILVRYGEENQYKIMVVDGGNRKSGEAIVEHVKKYYGTTHVDYVVNTHPHADHASGLSVVLDKLSVGELWLHRPWNYSTKIRDAFKDGRITDNSLSERMKESLNCAYDLEKIATSKKIPIKEPLQGANIGSFVVLSPSKKNYQELIPEFEKSPEQREKEGKVFKEMCLDKIEDWKLETLSETAQTTGENESSVVLYGNLNNSGILLTGDAGVSALTWAADYADKQGINLRNCKFIQMPHHGSRHNVTPVLLNRIIGDKLFEETKGSKVCFVCISKGSEEYPRKVVANAFKRRGADVFTTVRGVIRQHYGTMPERNWTKITPLKFYPKVEE